MDKLNNAQIRVKGIADGFENRLARIREMSEGELKDFESLLDKEISTVKNRINLVSILAGREIGEKSYEILGESKNDEFEQAKKEGTFEHEPKMRFDMKAQKAVPHEVYYSPESVFAKQANDKIATENELIIIKDGLNTLEKRRTKGRAVLHILMSAKDSIKTVRKEKKEAEYAAIIDAKKLKRESVTAMGKKLIERLKAQQEQEQPKENKPVEVVT